MGYFGSKATTGLFQALLGLQPPHDLYIETHLGGGALMARKAPAMRSIGIDRDQRALDRFRCEYPVELVHGCAHAFLASFAFRGTELVYSDPPYLHATRRSDRRYRYEYTDADHATLLALLRSLSCQVMVSGHPSALYVHLDAEPPARPRPAAGVQSLLPLSLSWCGPRCWDRFPVWSPGSRLRA